MKGTTHPELSEYTGHVVDSALKVHSYLGPGMLESAYEACLAIELRTRGLEVQTQVALPIRYGAVTLEAAYRIDLLVQSAVVVELKTVIRLLPVHESQLLSYLRLSGHRVGLLINFHVPRLKDGIRRFVHRA